MGVDVVADGCQNIDVARCQFFGFSPRSNVKESIGIIGKSFICVYVIKAPIFKKGASSQLDEFREVEDRVRGMKIRESMDIEIWGNLVNLEGAGAGVEIGMLRGKGIPLIEKIDLEI